MLMLAAGLYAQGAEGTLTPTPYPTRFVTPGPDGYPATISPLIMQQQKPPPPLATVDIRRASIFDFRIAYLINADLPESDVLSASNVSRLTGAVAFDHWDDFQSMFEESPFQILLVHDSMVDAVSLMWMHSAYRSSVMIVGINTGFQRYADMVGDGCIRPLAPDFAGRTTQNSWIFSGYQITTSSMIVRLRVDRAYLVDCTEKFDNDGIPVQIQHGDPLETRLDDEDDFEILIRNILNTANHYRLPRINADLTLTPAALTATPTA